MSRRTRGALAMAAATFAVFARHRADANADADGAVAGAETAPKHFDHVAHVARGVAIADHCQDCHGDDATGALLPPARHGHQPCLASGCHVEDFLSTGPTTEQRDPARYRRAAAFCAGCHTTTDGKPPPNFRRAKADAVFRGNPSPNYHAELRHVEHTERAKCRDCHVVDERTFTALYRPGHPQCASCHGRTASPPMTACGNCHTEPGRAQAFARRRPPLDLQRCDALLRRNMTPEQVAQTPCFKHERREHRFTAGGDALQCDSCHYMLSRRQTWSKRYPYATIADIKAAPIVDGTSMDRYCSAKGCHSDVDSTAPGKCERCHHPGIRKQLLSGFSH
jgi:hypothetical protein